MFNSGAFNLLRFLFFLAAGSLQGGCAIAIALRAFLKGRPRRAYYALPWCALVGVAVLAIGSWNDAAATATFYGWEGTTGVLRELRSQFPLIIPLVLVPLWLSVALAQYRPGRLYSATLLVTLLPAILLGLITSLWGLFIILVGTLDGISWFLNRRTP